MKCFLKEVFQDATKKILPKKQEIKRLYYREELEPGGVPVRSLRSTPGPRP